MAPPIPIGLFIPPITGVNNSLAPVANMFDPSGNFRSRTSSYKRRRGEDGGLLDNVFDLSREFPPLRNPAPLALDTSGIKSLLVLAAKTESDLNTITEKGEPGSEIVVIAKAVMALYTLTESLIEKAILPLCGGLSAAGGGGLIPPPSGAGQSARMATAPAPPPKPTGERELREAMERSDKESVLYDANLGQAATFNRARLSAQLSSGLKSSVIQAATAAGADVVEAVRVLDDAFSGVEDVDFIGQSSAKYNNKRKADDPKNGTFCTMPVKLKFPDRDSRIFFENSIRNLAGLKATQSFPKQIRNEMNQFMGRVKFENPDMIVMVRPDSRTLRINAFIKREGEKSWNRYHESHPIPLGIMIGITSASVTTVAATDQSAAPVVQEEESMLTDPSQASQEFNPQ